MPRVLLLVPSSTYRAGDFVEAAAHLGVEVVIGSEEDLPLPGARTVRLLFEDPERAAAQVVELDERQPLDAVVSVDDRALAVAAAAAELLGHRHNSADAVLAARDKVTMRARLARSEVTQPPYAVLAQGDDIGKLAELCARIGFPCVIKPTSLSGSQGVLRVDTPDDVVATGTRIRGIAEGAGAGGDAPLLVERFVAGPEVAVEGMLDDGELSVLAVFDKPDPLDGPAFEETIYVTPSRLGPDVQRDIAAALAAATRAMGLEQGPVHAELRLPEGRPTVIEVAARTIGGLCARALSFRTGKSLEALVLSQALGRPLSVAPIRGASGVLMIPIPGSGVLREVSGIDEARAVRGIQDVQITARPGAPLAAPPEGDRYLGFVFARAEHPSEVEAALRSARQLLSVDIVPG
ncbi:MAG: ATP-grasp domain-containing protein [Acidimicrobiales bacterium]